MTETLNRTYKYRLYPTKAQERELERLLAAAWRVYNDVVHMSKTRDEEGKYIYSASEVGKFWRAIRPEHALLMLLSSDMMTDVISRYYEALTAYARVKKINPDAKPPGEVSRLDFNTFYCRYNPANGRVKETADGLLKVANRKDGCDVLADDGTGDLVPISLRDYGGKWAKCYIRHVGNIRLRVHRNLPADAQEKQLGIQRDGDEWYMLIQFQRGRVVHPHPDAFIGIDIGLVNLLALSDGQVLPRRDFRAHYAPAIRRVQRRTDRQRRANNPGHYNSDGTVKEGKRIFKKSKRQRGAERQQRRVERRLMRTRELYWDTVTHYLTQCYSMIALEDLSLAFMTQASTKDIRRRVYDIGFAKFYDMLEYKAEQTGTELRWVDPRYTSQTCQNCGNVDAASRVTRGLYVCVACGFEGDADINAARNILKRALSGEFRNERTKKGLAKGLEVS